MKFLLAFLIILGYRGTNAQMPEYYAFLVKGNVTSKGKDGKTAVVRQKHFFYKEDIITLTKGAELTLSNKESQYLVLTVPKIYRIDSLLKLNHKKHNGVSKAYVDMLWHELADPDHDYSKFKKKNLPGVWGGVSRSESCNNLIFPVNGLKTSRDSLHFIWRQTSPAIKYILEIMDETGKKVDSLPIRDTQYVLPVSQWQQGRKGKYLWRVVGENASCEDEVPLYFDLLDKEAEKQLMAALLSDEKPLGLQEQLLALDKLEKNALIYAADDLFQKIITANPGDIALLKSYILFLWKYGFNKKAEAVWEENYN